MMPTSSFPTSYENLSTARLLDAYRRGPAQLCAALEGLDHRHLHARVIAGKWTIQEIALHLVDAEVMGAARIRQTLAQSGRQFAFYDQETWAKELAYDARDRRALDAAVGLFSALRATGFALLAGASADDWRKAGIHASLGVVTLRQLLELYADHSERHVAQILDRRELLGAGRSLPLVLETRLY